MGQNLDAVIERVAFFVTLETKGGPTAGEELGEEFLEVDRDRLKDGAKPPVDFAFKALPKGT